MGGVSGADAAWSDWPSHYLVEPGLWVQPFGAPHFAPGRGALFLDRDGVVIEDTGYPSDIATIVLRDSVVSVMREANEAGVPVVVGTGAQNPALAAAHAAHAQRVGAQGLMVIPRVLYKEYEERPTGQIW